MCRYKRVGYLDTDVGQPEFSPPGCLSLHIIGENILGTFVSCSLSFWFFIDLLRICGTRAILSFNSHLLILF